MTAHKRRYTTQPFALCKLSYTVFGRDTDEHMDMIWTRLCLNNFYSLLLTQFSQYDAFILFDCTIYLHPAIFRRKYNMVLTSPGCMF